MTLIVKPAALALCLLGSAALADPEQPFLDEVVKVDVLPGWRTESGTRMVGLHVRLAPNWKTYWRAPGEASIPPRFDWSDSQNLASVDFHWPVPEIFFQNGLRSVGYGDELVLPIELTPLQANRDLKLRSEMLLGVCKDICLPVEARITADLSGPGERDPLILAALEAQPDTAHQAGLRDITCEVEPISDGLRLTTEIEMSKVGPSEVVVFELPDQAIWVADAEATRTGGNLIAATELVPPSGKPFILDRSSVRITVLGDARAVDIHGCMVQGY